MVTGWIVLAGCMHQLVCTRKAKPKGPSSGRLLGQQGGSIVRCSLRLLATISQSTVLLGANQLMKLYQNGQLTEPTAQQLSTITTRGRWAIPESEVAAEQAHDRGQQTFPINFKTSPKMFVLFYVRINDRNEHLFQLQRSVGRQALR